MRGASAQLAKLIALALASGAGLLAGPLLARHVRGLAGLAPGLRVVAFGVAVGLVAYLVLSPLLVGVARRLVARGAWGRGDRFFGFVLGALRGAYLAWVLLLALPVANRAFQLSGSHWRFRTEGSRLERWIASGWSEQKRERAEFRSIIDRFRSLGLPDQ